MKVIVILIFHLPLVVFGQNLIPFESNGTWGYKDSLGNTMIEPQYQYARQFQENYAVVIEDGELGVINKLNNHVIIPQYEYLRYVGNEMFLFGYRSKYLGEFDLGIITSKNKILIPPEFYNIDFRHGYFIVTKQFHEVINRQGGYDTRRVSSKYGIIDSMGDIVLKPDYSRIKFLSDGYIIARKELNGNYALFDKAFNRLTGYDYMSISDFHNGLSSVRKNDGCGYLNQQGEEKIECKYERCSGFIDSFAIVWHDGKAGLVDIKGKLIIDFKFNGLGRPYKNQVAVSKGSKWGMINLRGELLLPFKYEKWISEFEGITAFLKNSKWRIWDYEKEKLLPDKYDELELIENDESLIPEFRNIKPKEYSQYLALVRVKDKWGVLNYTGEILIPVEFSKKELNEKLKSL